TVAAALDDQPLFAAAGEESPASAATSQSNRLRPDTPATRGAKLYGTPLSAAPQIDGVRDDWDIPSGAAVLLEGGHRVWTGVHDRYAYVFVEVSDADLVYRGSPGEAPFGDRLLVAVEPATADVREWLVLSTRAP